jgi:hypothetical protein
MEGVDAGETRGKVDSSISMEEVDGKCLDGPLGGEDSVI